MADIPKEERGAIYSRKMRLLDLYGACMDNAGKLIDEAKILSQHNAFARAAFLAGCGLEEMGKAQIVASFYNDDLSENEFKKSYRGHPVKPVQTGTAAEPHGMPDRDGAMGIDALPMQVDQDQRNRLGEFREPALYVEFDGDFKPIPPEKRVTRKAAETLIAKAFRTRRHILELDAMTEGIGAKGDFK
jgi:AbiV family abortive infection protein